MPGIALMKGRAWITGENSNDGVNRWLELDAMSVRPNLGKTVRIIYIAIGVVLVAGSFALALEGWERLILPVVGGGSIATGACGW